MPWISNLLLPIQKALQALSYLLLSLGSFSHRYLPPHLQIHHSTLSGWGIFHEVHTLFPAFRCSLPNLSPWVLCNFFTSTAQEPQLIRRQRHLLTFSCFLCLERGSWWCRRWCGARTPLTHPGNKYFTLSCFNLLLLRHWEFVLPFCSCWCDWICAHAHDLCIPAQCWPPHYASLVLQRFGNNPVSQYRVLSNLK